MPQSPHELVAGILGSLKDSDVSVCAAWTGLLVVFVGEALAQLSGSTASPAAFAGASRCTEKAAG